MNKTIIIYPSEITFTSESEDGLHGCSYLFIEIDEKAFEQILMEVIQTARKWFKEVKQYYEEHAEEF